jgi:hypothetical protein
MDRPYWNDERARLYRWIAENASCSFADLYKGAVINLYEKNPGCVRFISHAVREIINGMAAFKLHSERKQVQYVENVEKVRILWLQQNLPLRSVPPVEGEPLPETPELTSEVIIGGKLLEQIQILIEEHADGRKRSDDCASNFVQAFSNNPAKTPVPEPFANTWKKLQRSFHGRAHENGKSPTAEEIAVVESRFDQFELLLHSFADRYQQSLGRLDEILDQANK